MAFLGNADTAGCCRYVAATAHLFNQTVTAGATDWLEIVGMPHVRVVINMTGGPAPAAPGWLLQVAMRGDGGILTIPTSVPILALNTPITETFPAIAGTRVRVLPDTAGGQTYTISIMAAAS